MFGRGPGCRGVAARSYRNNVRGATLVPYTDKLHAHSANLMTVSVFLRRVAWSGRRRGERLMAQEHLTTAMAMYGEMGMAAWLAKAEHEERELR